MRNFWENSSEVFVPAGWEKMNWEQRVEAFFKSEESSRRFDWPFSMAVFGTLRQGQGNNRLMYRGKPETIYKAFLPHFFAEGIHIGIQEDSCAPFDIFYYLPENWEKMIPAVDALEGFYPKEHFGGKHEHGYYRTLAWLRVLPDDHVCEFFPKNKPCGLWGYRDMKIPKNEWNSYNRIPCWIYSSLGENKKKREAVIWPNKIV